MLGQETVDHEGLDRLQACLQAHLANARVVEQARLSPPLSLSRSLEQIWPPAAPLCGRVRQPPPVDTTSP